MKTQYFGITGRLALAAALVAIIAGCASPTVVEVKQTGDATLTCTQLKEQFDQAENYLKAAKKERTVTGTNVAAAILFLPGLLGTYVNTEEAINAAKDRQALLKTIAQKKKCNLDDTAAAPEAQPAQTAAASPAPAPAAKAAPVSTPMTAIEVQKQLLALGYQVGTPDGVFGKKSVDALKKFQKENSLAQSGKADTETVALLRQKAVK